MSDDDLDRLSRGDTEGTSIEGISVGMLAPSSVPRRAARSATAATSTGSVLAPGKYAFLLDSPDSDPPQAVPPGSMAILDVTP